MAYNNKYDYFAQIISQNISDSDIRRLTTRFERETYTNDPEKMLGALDKLFDEKWEEHYKKRLAIDSKKVLTHDPEQRKANFSKFLKKTLLSRDKLLFTDPSTKKKGTFDFRPLYQQYQEAIGEIKKRPEILPRIEKIVKITKAEVGKPGFFKPSLFVKRVENQIKNSQKAGHVDNLIAMRDAMRDLAFLPEKKRPISSFEAAKLYEQANKALTPYQDTGSKFGMKTLDELKIALTLEGVDVTNLKTQKQIKTMAKKQGVGFRRYQKTTNELIKDIISLGYDKRDLQKKSPVEIKKIWGSLRTEFQAPKRPAFIWQKDLPSQRDQIDALFKKQKQELTKTKVEKIEGDVSAALPFLTGDSFNKEVNRRLASEISEKPIIEKEIKERYLQWKYKDPSRRMTSQDLINLSKVTNNEFKIWMSEKRTEVIDPSGKKKIVREYVPKEAWRAYRDNVKENISKIGDINREREIEQERIFSEQILRDTGF